MNHQAPLPFRGNQVRITADLLAWHAGASAEPALEPGLPIVDAHHHLYGTPADASFYRVEDFSHDIGGHRVIGTAYVEAYLAGWRTSGPEGMRSLGEVERIAALSQAPLPTAQGDCQMAAAIVSHVDLALGDEVGAILDAHQQAGDGRLRGVRNMATHNEGVVGRHIKKAPQGLLGDAAFRRGYAWLERFGLGFDAAVFHTQIGEVAQLADAFPGTTIVLNHVGMPIGVEDFRLRRDEVWRTLETGLRELSARPNVYVKIGGLGMPVCGFAFETADVPSPSGILAQAWKPFIDLCLDVFGPARSMFESNFPVDKQSCGYSALWNAFKRATCTLSADERRDLFYRTACRAYRLPRLQAIADAMPA
jgi:predicted TIM-barrel fold metal-dependent hydrolase